MAEFGLALGTAMFIVAFCVVGGAFFGLIVGIVLVSTQGV